MLVTTLTYAGFNLIAALVSYPAGRLSDRWSRRKILLGSFLASLVVYLGFSAAQNLPTVIALFAAYGCYEATFRPIGRAITSDLVPEELRATAMGWYSATAGLFQLIASVVGGLLWDYFGPSGTFIYGVVSSAAGMCALLTLLGIGRAERLSDFGKNGPG